MAAISAGVAIAISAGMAGAATAYSTRSQQIASNKAETRAKGIAENERVRQGKQDSLLRAQEFDQAKRSASSLKALTGGRGGRRSLMANADKAGAVLGEETTLG